MRRWRNMKIQFCQLIRKSAWSTWRNLLFFEWAILRFHAGFSVFFLGVWNLSFFIFLMNLDLLIVDWQKNRDKFEIILKNSVSIELCYISFVHLHKKCRKRTKKISSHFWYPQNDIVRNLLYRHEVTKYWFSTSAKKREISPTTVSHTEHKKKHLIKWTPNPQFDSREKSGEEWKSSQSAEHFVLLPLFSWYFFSPNKLCMNILEKKNSSETSWAGFRFYIETFQVVGSLNILFFSSFSHISSPAAADRLHRID